MLKIAVWHNLPSGGGKRALHDHVKGLAARGHHVECWSPPTADLSYLPLSRYGVEHLVPLDEPPEKSSNRFTRRYGSYSKTLARMEAMSRHARRCVEEIESRGFDLILGNSCQSFAAPFLARYASIPTVLYLQEPYRRFYEAGYNTTHRNQLAWVAGSPRPLNGRSSLARWKERAGWKVQDFAALESMRVQAHEESLNVHAFDLVLSNSRFSREALLRIYGRNSRVCYLGVDVEAFRPGGGPKEPYAVGLGSIGHNKGLDVAIRALATIDPARRPDLVWIGNFSHESYLDEVMRLAASLGVNFFPKRLVEHDELVGLLERAAVMIYTSRLEPFGYAPLEANACGTAVVGVAEGGVRESIQAGVNGFLVDDDEPVALGRAVSRYVHDLDYASTEGSKARRHVEENWKVEQGIDRLAAHLEAALRLRRPIENQRRLDRVKSASLPVD